MQIKEKFKAFICLALEKCSVKENLKIAIIVGTILNLINQGPALLHLNFLHLSWSKFTLTYCVPYFVATYSASMTRMAFKVGRISHLDADIKCMNCNQEEITLHRGEVIPACKLCKEKTQWELMQVMPSN